MRKLICRVAPICGALLQIVIFMDILLMDGLLKMKWFYMK